MHETERETLLERFKRLFGSDLTNNSEDDVQFVRDASEVYNYGFEIAHQLRHCGHSIGDFRDPNYIIGKPETYTASEECIACKQLAELKAKRAIE